MRGVDMKLSNTSRLPSDLQRSPCGIEGSGICAKKDNGIAITSARQGHLDTGCCICSGGNFDPANSAEHIEAVSGETKGIDTPLTVVANGIGCEVGNDNSNGNMLETGIDNGDRKCSDPVILKWPCASCHEGAPCGVRPIDWSATGNRQINAHYDRGTK